MISKEKKQRKKKEKISNPCNFINKYSYYSDRFPFLSKMKNDADIFSIIFIDFTTLWRKRNSFLFATAVFVNSTEARRARASPLFL